MNVEEFYEATGGSYQEIIGRLRSDERIAKYLRMFQKDDSYPKLCAALAEENYKDAFMYSHNLKGVCANLGLGGLLKPSSELCEEMRSGAPGEGWRALFEEVQKQYEKVAAAVGELE